MFSAEGVAKTKESFDEIFEMRFEISIWAEVGRVLSLVVVRIKRVLNA